MKLPSALSFLSTTSKTPRQVISECWEDRDSLLQPDVNLFCWARPLDQDITHYLQHLLAREVEPISKLVEVSELENQMEEAKGLWGSTSSNVADRFWQDVMLLTRDFLSFSEHGSGTMHLRVVDDNACSKFHTDGYRMRLFTTYYGKGTEWLPEKAVDRSALGTSNDLIVKDAEQIRRMEAFHVGILKGDIPGTRDKKGIVHRSPQIASTGEKRIILRVDI